MEQEHVRYRDDSDSGEEFIASKRAGLTSLQRGRNKRARVDRRRIRAEEEEAANWEELKEGQWVICVEEVADFNLYPEMKKKYKGFHPKELTCPVFVGQLQEDCTATEIGAQIKVHRYRFHQGNLNGKCFPGQLSKTKNDDWIVSVDRSSVVLIDPVWKESGTKLSQKTKKALHENSSAPCILENGKLVVLLK